MGFLSTVPSDANERMRSAVSVAEKANNNFPGMVLFFGYICSFCLFLWLVCCCIAVSEPAPTGFVRAGTNAKGVPQATYPKSNSAYFMGPSVMLWRCCFGTIIITIYRTWVY